MADLKLQIIDLLQAHPNEPLPTLIIAKKLLGEKATTKDVNPTLYSLAGHGRLEKITEENGRNPRWQISTKENYRQLVVQRLQQTSESLSPRQLATELKLTRKEVNSILYGLKTDGLVIKTADEDGKNPRWSWQR